MSALHLRRLLAPLAAGAAFGALMQLGGGGAIVGQWAFHVGVPWLACAFAAGVLVAARPGGRRRRGAEAGAALMLAAVLAYYAVSVLLRGPSVIAYSAAMSVGWSAVGMPLAALFGAAGAVARAGSGRWRAACLALLGGTLCGEAILLLATYGGNPVFAVELVAGVACPLATLLPRGGERGRGRGRGPDGAHDARPGGGGAVAGRDDPALALGLTVLLALAAAAAGAALRLLMHTQGWTGP